MVLKVGNMWDTPAMIQLVTTNATLRTDGALVMGRGAAREAMTRYRNCNYRLGQSIQRWREQQRRRPYCILMDTAVPSFGAFQVKYNFWEPASVNLITASVDILCALCAGAWKGKSVNLNFPGIGNGQLQREEVLPLLLRLPGNVTVWELAGSKTLTDVGVSVSGELVFKTRLVK